MSANTAHVNTKKENEKTKESIIKILTVNRNRKTQRKACIPNAVRVVVKRWGKSETSSDM